MSAQHDRDGAEAQRSLVETLLDAALYAPLGALDLVRREAPRLVADGRRRAEQQVRTARWVGEMAVGLGRSKLESALAARRSPPAPHPVPVAAPAALDTGPEVPAAEPFTGYDSLAAVDLVPLLGRLSRPELEAVRDYESAVRGRRTVLARVEQLLAA